jgi:hypothetical protein
MIRFYSTTQLFQFSAKKIKNTYYDKSILKTPLINPDIVKIKILDRDRGQEGPLHTQSRQSAKLFLKSSELGLPQPLTRRRVCPLPPVLGGGAHSLARDGLGESQFRRGDIYTVLLFIYTYFVGT